VDFSISMEIGLHHEPKISIDKKRAGFCPTLLEDERVSTISVESSMEPTGS